MSIPKEVLDVVDFLKAEQNLQILNNNPDGRINSANSTKGIIALLEKQFNNVKGSQSNRDWYDIYIDDKYYAKIKISQLLKSERPDNTDAKRAIYYVLTSQIPKAATSTENYFKDLKKNLKQNDCDFYYIIIGKNEAVGSNKRAFAASLKTLAEVHPSAYNFPFQCRWQNCMTPKKRSYSQAKKFLLSNYRTSMQKADNLLQSAIKIAKTL